MKTVNLEQLEPTKPLTMEELASLRALCDNATQGDRRFRQVRDHCDEYDAFLMPLDLHIPDSIPEGDCEFLKQIDPDTVRRLIAAAERSIRRPIADAPMDGTAILAFCPTFYRGKGGHVVALFQDGDWWAVPGAFKIIPTHFYTIPGKGEM